MKLLEKIRALGCQLRLVQTVAQPAAEPVKVATRTVSLQDLMTRFQAEDVRALADAAVEMTIPYDRIFASAGLDPRADGALEACLTVMDQAAAAGQKKEQMRQALIGHLTAGQDSAETVVRGALARDQALDAFEGFVCQKIEDRSARRQRRLQELETEMQKLRLEQGRLQEESDREQKELQAWRKSKARYDKQLADLVDLLVAADPKAGKGGPKPDHL